MTDSHFTVTFQPQGRTVSVLAEATFLEAAALAGLVIDTPCGGTGTCGKCRVQVTGGAVEPEATDRAVFTPGELASGWRLACQHRVRGDLKLYVPRESLFGTDQHVIQDRSINVPVIVKPAVQKMHIRLTPPDLEDPRPDLVRLEEQIGPFKVDVALLRSVPGRLRQWQYEGTAVLAGHHLIDFEKGDTTSHCYGAAVDIGTTTMVVSVVNLCTGEELAIESRMNPQVSYGDDVLARIRHSTSCPDCLEELRRTVVDEIGDMIRAACSKAGIKAETIYEAVFAGNTTMQHLLCGVDPSPLGTVPFAPAYGRGMLLLARELDIPINPRGYVYVFPVIGGFVGGDTVAGMLATRLDEATGPLLLVDIGTNGEVVLAHNNQLLAASTAAGPAFEGARISCGMRAMRGAIEKVLFDDDVQLGVIGDGEPAGICGSGIIDLLAELLRVGIV